MDIELKLILTSIGQPWVLIQVNDKIIDQQINGTSEFIFDFKSNKKSEYLTITHYNKKSDDAETAVIIKEISFFGITDPRFIWQGIYTPNYPEPWYSEQLEKPCLTLKNQTHLSWNGTWQLEFDVPVFTWMHRVLGFGWIYS